MEKEIQKSKCENCNFYIQHYRIRFSKIHPLSMGHCSNANVPQKKSFKHGDDNPPCEFYVPKEEQIATQQEHIFKTIKNMQKSLNEIALILKETEKYLKNKTPDE